MKLIALAGIALAVSMTGCASSPGIKANIVGANIEIAKQRAAAAAKPVLNASIPVPGCKAPDGTDYKTACVMTIVVHAPQGANTGQIAMPDDPAWRVADRAVGVLGTAAGLWIGGEAAVGLVQATGGVIGAALRAQPAPTVVTQPAPVIVSPADPVIVEQPAPVIVNPVIVEQPAPVIVNPVVVQVQAP